MGKRRRRNGKRFLSVWIVSVPFGGRTTRRLEGGKRSAHDHSAGWFLTRGDGFLRQRGCARVPRATPSRTSPRSLRLTRRALRTQAGKSAASPCAIQGSSQQSRGRPQRQNRAEGQCRNRDATDFGDKGRAVVTTTDDSCAGTTSQLRDGSQEPKGRRNSSTSPVVFRSVKY